MYVLLLNYILMVILDSLLVNLLGGFLTHGELHVVSQQSIYVLNHVVLLWRILHATIFNV